MNSVLFICSLLWKLKKMPCLLYSTSASWLLKLLAHIGLYITVKGALGKMLERLLMILLILL